MFATVQKPNKTNLPKSKIKISEVPPKKNAETFKSSLGIKYPTLRDHPLHTGAIWLAGKRVDDGAGGLWRIHDNLYDLTDFVALHPGGADWLELTKGTDITEAFESHHLSNKPAEIMGKYFVEKAKSPRNFPFTFAEGGFYKTLKTRIYKKLQTVPKSGEERSKFYTDGLLLAYIVFSVLSVYWHSFLLVGLAGVFLSLTAIAAHNFFHKKDNFRMYYFDLTMMQSKEWRISHAMSHHMYPNTVSDLEISSLEPFLQYLPHRKNLIFRYFSWIYSPVFYAFMFIGHFVKTLMQWFVQPNGFSASILLPFTIPVLTFLITRESIGFCFAMFFLTEILASIYFGIVGVNAAHHHPDIFHDGDAPRVEEMDWGIFQVDAVMDRADINNSHFLILTNFGNHALHHLFPTVDHGLLEHLEETFEETCKEFGVKWRVRSQLELMKGQYRQLAKVEPNKSAPK